MSHNSTVPELRPHPHALSRRLEDEVIIVHLATDRIYNFSDTAGRMWELLQSGCDGAEIRRQLLREFDVDPDQLAKEMESLFVELKREGLVLENE